MNKFAKVILMVLLSFLMSSELFAQRGGRGNGQRGMRGNQNGQSAQGNRGQRGFGQNQRNMGSQGQHRHGLGSENRQGMGRAENDNGQQANQTLTANDHSELILMREEEKLARDVYAAMKTKWGSRVFSNIGRAESRHMQAIGNLLNKYGIPDPIVNDKAGVFTNPKFQKLFTSLVAAGSASETEAFKVGLKIEEMDIADLQAAIAATNNAELKKVYQRLLRASMNHLRAFAAQLNRVGGTYTPGVLQQTEFDSIASSKNGQGRGRGMGKGQGGNKRDAGSADQGRGGKRNHRQ